MVSVLRALDQATPVGSTTVTSRVGYKPSEIGLIPRNWETVPLGEVLEFQNGVNADAKAYGSGIPFANVLEVITHSHLNAADIPGRVQLPPNRARAYRVCRGDVLFNRTSETQDEVALASVYVDEEDVVFGGFVIRGRPIGSTFDPVYCGYAWREESVRSQIVARGQGAIRANIGQSDLRTVIVPQPPVPEQKGIAEALSDADELIQYLDRLIDKKRQIKHGATQDLLSGRMRLPGCTGQWKQEPFRKIFDFYPTATNSRSDLSESGDTYYIHYGDIHTRFHGHLDLGVNQPPRIARARCLNAAYVRNGDWIMVDASEDFDGVGKSIEILGLPNDERAVAGLHTFLLREKTPTFVPGYKGHMGDLATLHDQYRRVMTGMKVFGVSKAALRDLVLSVPPPTEQTAIVAILDDMEAEIDTLRVKVAKARQVKQGMMQELLTGRVRLV